LIQVCNVKSPVTVEIEFGGVPELLLQQAAQAQMVALGRRGHGHTTDPDHLGRNFRAIAHQAHQPMLIVWLHSFIQRLSALLLTYLPHLVLAGAILVLGLGVAIVAQRLVQRLLRYALPFAPMMTNRLSCPTPLSCRRSS
jgi:hypothetical protein